MGAPQTPGLGLLPELPTSVLVISKTSYSNAALGMTAPSPSQQDTPACTHTTKGGARAAPRTLTAHQGTTRIWTPPGSPRSHRQHHPHVLLIETGSLSTRWSSPGLSPTFPAKRPPPPPVVPVSLTKLITKPSIAGPGLPSGRRETSCAPLPSCRHTAWHTVGAVETLAELRGTSRLACG